MTTEAAAKKDIQKLQRVIIDGLEDVKAQDIQVFDTEHLSALFERVIIASGTSNRQTKALAMSVRDAVNEAKFGKPRLEGESNGEWIIVDCGAAVVHIMQPAIRQYYHLEELWGDKPVRLKFGAVKPVVAVAEEAPAKKKAPIETLRRSSAAKTAIKAAEQVLKAEKEAERAAEHPRRGPSRKGPGARSGSAVANSRAVAKRALPAGKTTTAPAGKTAAAASKPVARPAVKAAVRPAAPAAPVVKTAARPAAKTAAKTAAVKTAAKQTTKVAAKTAAVAKPVLKVIGKPAAKAVPAKKAVARKIAVPRK